MTTLPDSLACALPSRERRSPGLELQDGRWMVAAKSGLYVFGAEVSSNEAGPSPDRFPWYDVARARWEAEGELFALEWVKAYVMMVVERDSHDCCECYCRPLGPVPAHRHRE